MKMFKLSFLFMGLLSVLASGCTAVLPPGADNIPPRVDYTYPLPNETNIPLNNSISATFSEPMDPNSIDASAIIMDQNGTSVQGVVSYVGSSAMFTPAINLMPNSNYRVTVLKKVRDLAGNMMLGDYTWSFTTGNPSAIDTTAPAPGASGALAASGIGINGLTLDWIAATDAVTDQNNLQYIVYRSASNNINTVVEAENNGIPVNSFTSGITSLYVSGLQAATSYYFNVIVRDMAGNKASYTMVSATTLATTIHDGLVGEWLFSGDPNDSSGSGNHGTVSGAVLTMDRFDNQNKAYDFNNTSISSTTSNFPLSNNARTMTGWVRRNVAQAIPNSLLFGYGKFGFSNKTFELLIENSTGKLVFSSWDSAVKSTSALALSTWYFVAVTYDGATVRIYVNDTMENSAALTLATDTNGNDMWFAKNPADSNQYFQGSIDDVRIYDRVLSSAELSDLYTIGSVTRSGLVGEWKFTGDANDTSGSGNDGTVTGATLTTDRLGNSDSAYLFDANTKIKINAATTNLPLSNSSRTMIGWVKINVFRSNEFSHLFGYGRFGTTNNTFELLLSNWTNKLVFSQWGSSLSGSTSLSLDTWYLVAATYDGSMVKLYVNGVLDASQSMTLATSTSGSDAFFGKYDPDTRYLEGSLDNIRIYNRVLSQQEMDDIYNEGCYVSNY